MSSNAGNVKDNIFTFMEGGEICVYTVCLNKQF